MSGSPTRGGGENVPGIPGACATRNFTYLVRGPLERCNYSCLLWHHLFLARHTSITMHLLAEEFLGYVKIYFEFLALVSVGRDNIYAIPIRIKQWPINCTYSITCLLMACVGSHKLCNRNRKKEQNSESQGYSSVPVITNHINYMLDGLRPNINLKSTSASKIFEYRRLANVYTEKYLSKDV